MFRWRSDTVLTWTLRGCAVISGAVILLIVLFLVVESLPALRQIGIARFFSDASWHPAANGIDGSFNLTPMLLGTLLATAGAVLLATPLGIGSAVFCNFYAPAVIARPFRRLVELLAGIPSVVFGLWGLVVLVPLIGRLHPPGPGLLAAIIILAVMILPTVALLADAALANVPAETLRGVAALGLSRWRTVCQVALPTARPGLMTGVILETGRALGETMAVLMVCGNVVRVPHSLFDPMRTLTANIALEMSFAMGDHRSALFVCGLVLTGLIVLLVTAAEIISGGRIHV